MEIFTVVAGIIVGALCYRGAELKFLPLDERRRIIIVAIVGAIICLIIMY